MTSSSMSRALVAMLAIVALSGCKPVDDVMVLIFGRSMRDQRSFDPYENTRPSPENSISFASGNYPLEFGVVNVGQPEGADVPRFTQADLGVPGVGALVVQGLTNPLDRTDPRSMERGEELYMRFCAVCHGDDGVGANAYIADKHPTLPAYNLSGAQVAAYSDQYLYAMIRVGRGLMPEYGSRITHFDRWTIVNYVRELQLQAGNTPGSDVSGGGPPAGE
ncbi:MAG TPA: cytochrome c [Gemmatimonadetes bacterium]|nr:cytochrome c [Gemmatimonadota bacterium]HIN79164.1 cytochrome c [Gemmatimonadota bacterium]